MRTIQAGTRPSCTKASRMAETNTLSAVRSKKIPRGDTTWYFRARMPSKRSVMDARKKTTVAVRKAQGWLTITSANTRTVAAIRLKLSRLGRLRIAKILLIQLVGRYQRAEVLLLLNIAPAAWIRATSVALRIKPPAMKGP